jgi:Cu-Zn family superoxide dismutase
VHIHAVGRCDPPDFASAGGHYDPADAEHGMPDADTDMNDPDHHAGDMLNQTVNDNGMLDALLFNQSVTVAAGPNALLDQDGSALVIHARGDDYESQPAGAAGDRVACAPITA